MRRRVRSGVRRRMRRRVRCGVRRRMRRRMWSGVRRRMRRRVRCGSRRGPTLCRVCRACSQSVNERTCTGDAQTGGYQATDEPPSADPPGQVPMYEFLVGHDAHPL
jgi:hypothetical protein